MKQYEYMKVNIRNLTEPHYTQLDIEKLNEHGALGWELITIASGEAIFKKEKKVRTVRPL